MVFVAEHELQRVRAGRQGHTGFRLAFPVVDVVVIFRNGGTEVGHGLVNEQVVMAAVRLVGAGGDDVHAFGAEFHRHRARNLGAVLRLDNEDLGSWRCGRPFAVC